MSVQVHILLRMPYSQPHESPEDAAYADTPSNAPEPSESSRRFFLILTSVTAAIGGFLFGYDTAVISGAILFVRRDLHLTAAQTEFAVSIVLAGALIGAALGGYLGDRFGRRRTLVITAIVFGVFGLTTGLAAGLWPFVLSRFLVGCAVGVSSMLAPLYIAELAPKHIRGALVTLSQLAISTGVVVAYYVDYLLAAGGNWRWMFISALVPSVILLLGLIYLPESPRWLAAEGRFAEAASVLARAESAAEVREDLKQLQVVTATDNVSFRDLAQHRFRKPLLVGIVLAVIQQVTGVNTIVYYAPTILQMVGFGSAGNAILATFLIGFVGLLTTIVSMFLVDRVGRRILLLVSIGGMGISLVHLAWTLGGAHPTKWVVLTDILVYLAAFDIGLGPVFWLLISEIYPTTVRAEAMSLATMANWGSNFLVAATFLSLVDHLGMRGSFLLFAALCFVAFLFAAYMVPETRGRTLEQIESSWR
ncbi:MAG TPA: sugar porter family MFS transporter [Candidatus Sulfotelmatobacter sp.]|nr:sugar porter family MFS transporter [Candidatus Sulfotelmatobacter sp.]